MGVYIKCMEMPACCSKCGFFHHTYDSGWSMYDVCRANNVRCNDAYDEKAPRIDPFKEKLASCPLVEVPDHGDLIDRDALMKKHSSGGT